MRTGALCCMNTLPAADLVNRIGLPDSDSFREVCTDAAALLNFRTYQENIGARDFSTCEELCAYALSTILRARAADAESCRIIRDARRFQRDYRERIAADDLCGSPDYGTKIDGGGGWFEPAPESAPAAAPGVCRTARKFPPAIAATSRPGKTRV